MYISKNIAYLSFLKISDNTNVTGNARSIHFNQLPHSQTVPSIAGYPPSKTSGFWNMLPLSPNSVLPIYTYMCNPSKFIASSVRIFTSFIITFALQTPLIYNSPKSHSENTSNINMSSPKSHRRKHEDKNRKASSFHGRTPETMAVAKLNRPRTVPDLLAGRRVTGVSSLEGKPAKLTKLLLNVTVQRSLGAVMVIMSPESTVGDLIAAVIRQYVKEGRRPILGSTDCGDFDLHYSQFSLESKFSPAKRNLHKTGAKIFNKNKIFILRLSGSWDIVNFLKSNILVLNNSCYENFVCR